MVMGDLALSGVGSGADGRRAYDDASYGCGEMRERAFPLHRAFLNRSTLGSLRLHHNGDIIRCRIGGAGITKCMITTQLDDSGRITGAI